MREKQTGIYMLTCQINGNRYVGQSQDITRRMWEHKHHRNLPHLPVSRAIKKYGWENFSKDILELCPIEELDEREIYYIAKLEPEYNVSKGGYSGMRGYHHSTETREKCRQAAIKEWQDKTDEEKEMIIKNQLTGKRFTKGHSVSKDVREKLRQANLGKKQSKETIEKRVRLLRGRKRENSHMFKPVICVETGEIFPSIKDAALSVGVHKHEITAVLRGYRNRKTSGGYHWKYYDSVETNHDECSDVGEKNELLLEVHGNLFIG